MFQQVNPFIQHALRHGKMFIDESNRSAAMSQSLVSSYDEIISALNIGNIQGAINSAQNARNLAVQVAQSTQHINYIITERMQMATYILDRIQYSINELSNALHSSGYTGTNFRPDYWQQTQTTPNYQNTTIM